MSAYFDTGFCVRTPSWHRQENLLQEYPKNWAEARVAAGLTWEPKALPVFEFDGDVAAAIEAAEKGQITFEDVARRFRATPGQQRILRDDTNMTLGITSTEYNPITHDEIGQIMEALLNIPNVKYDTAGAVREGRQVWAMAYLDEPIRLPGDPSVTLPYVSIGSRHDGLGALTAKSHSVRVVCANTWTASDVEAAKNNTVFTFQHRGNWQDRIEEAKQTIRGVRRDFQLYAEVANELALAPVTQEQTEVFIREFIPAPPDGLISERVKGNIAKQRDVMRLILAGPTSEGIAGTAYGLVQAAGEYSDHYRMNRTMDSALTRQLLSTSKLKTRALSLAREVMASA